MAAGINSQREEEEVRMKREQILPSGKKSCPRRRKKNKVTSTSLVPSPRCSAPPSAADEMQDAQVPGTCCRAFKLTATANAVSVA